MSRGQEGLPSAPTGITEGVGTSGLPGVAIGGGTKGNETGAERARASAVADEGATREGDAPRDRPKPRDCASAICSNAVPNVTCTSRAANTPANAFRTIGFDL